VNRAPATVVLPTIGRLELIRVCLESLRDCDPQADEILVIDSSRDESVAGVVATFSGIGARTLRCPALGLGTAFNFGLREAANEIVLLTNDDCTVDPSWVGRGVALLGEDGAEIMTGRVRPGGDPEVVPSTIDDPHPREHVGRPDFVLYTQCMALRRTAILDFGGFDGQIRPTAEDNDLSYRWLRAGRRIGYAPDFVVWHHDWRTPYQLERLYVNYGIGQGMVYGKHLARGDALMLRYLVSDVVSILRALGARVIRGRPQHPDPRLGLLLGLPTGLARGWRAGRGRRSSADIRP